MTEKSEICELVLSTGGFQKDEFLFKIFSWEPLRAKLKDN